MRKIINWFARLIARCFLSYLTAIIFERVWNFLVYSDADKTGFRNRLQYARPERIDFTKFARR